MARPSLIRGLIHLRNLWYSVKIVDKDFVYNANFEKDK